MSIKSRSWDRRPIHLCQPFNVLLELHQHLCQPAHHQRHQDHHDDVHGWFEAIEGLRKCATWWETEQARCKPAVTSGWEEHWDYMEPTWDCCAGLDHGVADCNIGITRPLPHCFASLISGGEPLSSILSSIFLIMIIATPCKTYICRSPVSWWGILSSGRRAVGPSTSWQCCSLDSPPWKCPALKW